MTQSKNKISKLGETKTISIAKLEYNEGQLDGLPKNPRYLKQEEHDKLKKSLLESGELLQYNSLMVYPLENGNYVTICGNMRLHIANELVQEEHNEYSEIPCFVLNADTSIFKIKEYAIKDNVQAGNWDWDELANNDWDVDELQDWGLECAFLNDGEELGNEEQKEEKDYSDSVTTEYKLEVDCKNEETLQQLYEELTERELECRILTL